MREGVIAIIHTTVRNFDISVRNFLLLQCEFFYHKPLKFSVLPHVMNRGVEMACTNKQAWSGHFNLMCGLAWYMPFHF